MDYYPNQECMFEFCAKVMPMLRAQRPTIKLAIVGADPSPAVRKLGELPGITVTGSVPDVRPYLHEAALMIAPLNIARGTQNKILESMAAGVPVVASRIAAGGVDAGVPEHMLTASTPDEYVAAVLQVLGNPGTRDRLARAGRARMLSHHAWPESMRRLDRIVDRCLSKRSACAVTCFDLVTVAENHLRPQDFRLHDLDDDRRARGTSRRQMRGWFVGDSRMSTNGKGRSALSRP